MKVYVGSFRKKNGDLREMIFAHLEDIEKVNPDFVGSRILGTGRSNIYPDGMKLVWDLDNDDFRVFNYNTKLDLREIEVEDEFFW